MAMIDLRSDTVTQPTPAMREAMAYAPVGDDVYGEDPTINQLQEEAAAMLGKEAALFVSSGTQGNLTAILAHCQRGDEIILGKRSHIFLYEAGSASAYGGVQLSTLDVRRDGTLDLDDIRGAVRGTDQHYPISRLICLENTQGSNWGAPLSADYTAQVGALARQHGLKLHIDGARLFNASAALKTPVDQLVRDADSVTFCLSKGLCAPVGSILVGSKAFIARAHHIRKSLGGGMRQAGILGAAGLIALREMTAWERLDEDHANARALAQGLAQMPYIDLDMANIHTNMIFFALTPDCPVSLDALADGLKARGILALPYSPEERQMRMVTHYWIKREHVDQILDAVRAVLVGDAQPTIVK
ncbi:MAG: low-specificity L-threonine aldolase [bacterium]|nr:low-specificity L-threonine aldolase [bacterium]